MQKLYFLFITLILIFGLSTAKAQSYHLDSTFSGSGIDIVTPDVPAPILYQHYITQMSVMADGRIVMSGIITGSNWFEIIRLHSDGTPDSTFNNNGIITFATTTEAITFTQLKVDASGNIFLCGTAFGSGNSNFCVYKITSAGRFDSTFAGSGMLEIALNTWNFGQSFDIQNDGKIVVGGYTEDNTTGIYEYCLTRLLADGTLDTAYGTSGYAVCMYSQLFKYSPTANMGYCVSRLAGNKMLLSGMYTNINGSLFIVRYNSTGTPDSSYGVNGLVQVSLDSNYLLVLRQVTDDSGNAYELCQYRDLAEVHLDVIKITSSGKIDSSYGINGIASIDSIQNVYPYAYWGEFLQSGGKLLVAGTEDTGINAKYAVTRLTSAGVPDTTFGPNGILTVYRGMNDHCNSGALIPEGDILLAGYGQQSLSNDTLYGICIKLTNRVRTAVAEVGNKQIAINVYPNPTTNGKYTLKCNMPVGVSNLHLSLSDMSGKVLSNSIVYLNGNSIFEYELPDGCTPGTYLLTVTALNSYSTTLMLTSL
ncbi:MAG TPA: T9SS type A sorting domain-containing protein [Flavipsychrobacter sp.]|nr:T9SS type A sorting domain-containing protein [Flavipsychrobacter sp.]